MPLLTPWLLLGISIGQQGCNRPCDGPSCEDAYPRTLLVAHLGPLEGWVPAQVADRSWQGTEEQGAAWSLAAGDRFLAVGMPEGEVTSLRQLVGEGTLEEVAAWEGAAELGAAVTLGDAEQDGRWDLWMGAPAERLDRGAVFLLRSASSRGGVEPEEADVVVRGVSPGDRLGERLVPCADLTGDGRPEWLLAAPRLSASEDHPLVPSLAGGVWLVNSELLGRYVGTVSPDQLGPLWWGDEVGARTGAALSCDRDLTGDGVPDILIGAPLRGSADQGSVFLLEGARLTATTPGERPGTGSLAELADEILDGPWEDAWLGASLAVADLDVDGAPDLAVGAPGHAQGRGRVLVYRGADLVQGTMDHRITLSPDSSREAGDHVGTSLAVGDVDGDGQEDLVVGVPDWRGESGDYDVGRASIWLGRPFSELSLAAQLDRDEDLALVGTSPFQRVGRDVLVHDLDDDGVDDVLLPTRVP